MPKPPTEEPVCPTCGRDDFASERGLKSHHSRAHGEKLGMVTVDCANCGVEMERERSQIKDNEYTYCSQDCVNEHKQDRYSGDGIDHQEANDLENLISLCRECHRKVESDSHSLSV